MSMRGNCGAAARTWTGTKSSLTPSPRPPRPSTSSNPGPSHERVAASRCGYGLWRIRWCAAVMDWGSPVEPIDQALEIAGPSRIRQHPELAVPKAEVADSAEVIDLHRSQEASLWQALGSSSGSCNVDAHLSLVGCPHAGVHGTTPSTRTGRTGWPLPTRPGLG